MAADVPPPSTGRMDLIVFGASAFVEFMDKRKCNSNLNNFWVEIEIYIVLQGKAKISVFLKGKDKRKHNVNFLISIEIKY